MRIIISPAKKMNVDTDFLAPKQSPQFLEEAEIIKNKMQALSLAELKKLYAASDEITKLNYERLKNMDFSKAMTPAILSYEGIQFQYMGAQIFEKNHFDYVEEHLRILSAMFGMLKPFDAVVPYRLEMQAKLAVGSDKNLYQFWGKKIADALLAESDCMLNLASKEYSKVVSAHLPKDYPFVTCVFGEEKDGKIIEKGTMCKMARGLMVRFLAENNIRRIDDAKSFCEMDYRFSKIHSDDKNFVFIKSS
ncbi:MAG: peroxide stress protein YaaA [Peptostreptococcaceae bacterium]|nr:peroxide stress protein YaaA [Peptostreptococcaceae bacterium]